MCFAQRVPHSSAADGDRAVKKRDLRLRTPPQAATGAPEVAEDAPSDGMDASEPSQQVNHSVRRSTRPEVQRQKRVPVGGSASWKPNYRMLRDNYVLLSAIPRLVITNGLWVRTSDA